VSTTSRVMACTTEDVFSVLADGWVYPLWVVGAARIRDVDAGWPAVGSRIHHSVGAWPALLDDTTSVMELDPGRRIRLRARAWPGGEAKVVIDVEPLDEGCRVTITEQAVRGPATWVPKVLQDVGLHPRNVESLRRLAYLAENREASRREGRPTLAAVSGLRD
jgi:hypothetical protein